MLTYLPGREVPGADLNSTIRPRRRRSGIAATAALACAVALLAPAAHATAVSDATGDILGTFSGNHNAADLDVTSASVTFSNDIFHLSATLAGNVRATTPNAAYVWGIDRGNGTAVLNQGPAPVGAGVTFDTVVVFLPDGNAVLLQANENGPFGAPALLTPTISGDTLTVDVALSLLSSLPGTDPDFDPDDYRFNFWPRVGLDVTHGEQVSDFAPGGADGVGSTFTIPEPGSLALMIAGLGFAGVRLRRRRILS